jgi:hypothetical protein
MLLPLIIGFQGKIRSTFSICHLWPWIQLFSNSEHGSQLFECRYDILVLLTVSVNSWQNGKARNGKAFSFMKLLLCCVSFSATLQSSCLTYSTFPDWKI